MARHAPANIQRLPPGMHHEFRRLNHHFQQYRLQATALRSMPDWRNLARQSQLSQQAQAVVGEGRQIHDRIVSVELARGQSFQIQIGLDLRVEQPLKKRSSRNVSMASKRDIIS